MNQFRNDLSSPGLWLSIKDCFNGIRDPRLGNGNTEIPLPSALMAVCAMFALKYPSLLQFEQKRADPTIAHNLKSMFHVSHTPSDTQMREILDKVFPEELQTAFDVVLTKAQRGKVLEGYKFLDRGYLLSVDGTGYFDSSEVRCESCCVKEKKDGTFRYYHQFLPAVLVHPEQKQVFPIRAEPITKQDGEGKNDCEQNAVGRLLKGIRASHPKLRLVVVLDALYGNGPRIGEITGLGMDFIIVVKERENSALFRQAKMYTDTDEATVFQVKDEKEMVHQFRFKNDVWLNGEFKQKVNFLEYFGYPKIGQPIHWAWITNIPITKENAMDIMRGGRARWRIENETFNTLKNQGYHFEHNFGHGYKNLSTNFALLMLLAFTVDQLLEHCCKVFQAAKEVCHSRIVLWETMRNNFRVFAFNTWEDFFHSIIYKKKIFYDSS